jgi:hypothetical protein
MINNIKREIQKDVQIGPTMTKEKTQNIEVQMTTLPIKKIQIATALPADRVITQVKLQ